MRVLFLGNRQVAVPALEAVVTAVEPKNVRVITSVGKPGDVNKAAEAAGVELDLFDRKRDKLKPLVERTSFDVAIVISFSQILPRQMLERHDGKFYNIHFSDLPRWRGASPVQSAILAGDTSFGVNIQEMAPKLDSGKVVLSEKIELPNTPYHKVMKVLSAQAAEMVHDFLDKKSTGALNPKAQDESKVTYAPKIDKSASNVSLRDSVETVWRKYLAFNGWQGHEISIATKWGNMKIIAMSQEKLSGADIELQFNGGSLWLQVGRIAGKNDVNALGLRNGYGKLF